MKESRKSIRVDAQLFISYDVLDKKGQVVQAGMALSKDLSKKGVQMQERSSFPLDTNIQIHLAVGNEVIDVNGKVRNVKKIDEKSYRIGIEFSQIDEELLEKLSQQYPDILEE